MKSPENRFFESFRDSSARRILEEFPNPERLDCPGREALQEIASQAMPTAQARTWAEHINSCSPCQRELLDLRTAYTRRRRQITLAVAAGLAIFLGLGSWGLLRWYGQGRGLTTATVDLSDRSLERGPETRPEPSPIPISRRASRLDIHLPGGSTQGDYDVRIVGPDETLVVATASGYARRSENLMLLQVKVDLSTARTGPHLLQIRQPGLRWNSYAIVLR